MAGKAKFDQEAAFKSIIGPGREMELPISEQPVVKEKNKNRVQRSYFLDRDIEKALKKKSLEDDVNLTETINALLRSSLSKYLQKK